MGTAWQMPLAVIGKPTGDGRQFDPGALGHRDLPLPFRYVAQDSGGHQNAVIVGHISKIGREKDGLLPAKGEFYDDESWPDEVRNAAIAAKKFTENKVIGPSVDLDQQEVEHVPEPKAYTAWKKMQAGKLKAAKMAHSKASGGDCGCGSDPVMAEEAYDGPRLRMIRSGRMASATLVHIPAFAELSGHAKLTPIDSSDPNVDGTTSSAMMATAADFTDMAGLFDWAGVEWGGVDPSDDKIENDGEMAAKKRKLDPEKVKGNQDDEEFGSGIWLSDTEFEEFAKKLPRPNKANQPEMQGTDGEQAQGGGTYRGDSDYAPGGPDVTKTAVRKKLDDADFVDPKGRRFPIASCADIPDAVSSYGRANPKIPYAEFKSRLTAIAKRKGCEGSLPDNWKAGEKMAALMAGAAPVAPPKGWFDDPKLPGPTPLHIGDDGRVYGHVAVWDTCHVGIGDSCVKPPKSLTSYAYFHTGEVATDDGSRVAVGRLTYGGGHAQPNLGYRAAAEHYDQTSNVGALVRAGEDEHGIWVSGTLAPDADDTAVRAMRAAPLSGDWRRIGGNLEMVAALHVNTAGFPIPRVLVASMISGFTEDDEVLSLTAAGVLPRVIDDEEQGLPGGVDMEALGRAVARGMAAENAAIAEQQARAAEWRELLASATADSSAADYAEAVGDLLVALVE
jgi:hypothetical protein